MAASITPKSKVREVNNISVGYGEVPAVLTHNRIGWGLPGKGITYCRDEATAMATQLDKLIRANLDIKTQKLL